MESSVHADSVRGRGCRGGVGTLVATLIATPAAVVGTALLIHILGTCHDTDAHTGIAVNYFLWPIATPALWFLETATIAGVLAGSTRLASTRRTRIPLMAFGTVIVLGMFTWTYWHLGLNTMSTGLVATTCPAGAPAWWPTWLPLY
jgi:hypothetical protein